MEIAVARKFVEIRRSDLSGVEGDSVQGVTLSVDGRAVEVDLTPGERAELDTALRPYLEAGRKVRASATRLRGGRRRDVTALRKWAQEQGYPLGDRGKIPHEIEAAYARAHASS